MLRRVIHMMSIMASNMQPRQRGEQASSSPGASPTEVPSVAAANGPKSRWPKILFWAGFFGIFALGAFLRFWRLGEQSFWCDETATLGRVSGTFGNLLRTLNGQGFPCGWYTLLWGWGYFLKHFLHMSTGYVFTPSVMRAPGAFLGSLIVPTGYLLARQFMNRRAALLVMLLFAINPFLIYYSRDLKMYGAFYFFVTLNAALFLCWLRGRWWIWYPLYAASAAAMIMTDYLGWLFLAIELAWMLLRTRRRGFDMPLFVTTMGIGGVLTYWWWRYHTWFYEGVAYHHTRGGITWVARYTHMDLRTVMGQPAISLLGFLWPTYPPSVRILDWYRLGPGFLHHLATRGLPYIEQLELGAAVVMVAVLVMGLIPWSRIRGTKPKVAVAEGPSEAEKDRQGRWWFIALWLIIPGAIFGLGSLPKSNPFSLYPHFVIWLPRYMGLMAMGWIIWMGWSITRLPGMVVRVIAGAFLCMVMLASALTNNLICRQEPWAFVNRAVKHYYNPKDHLGMFIAYSLTNHPQDDAAINMLQEMHVPLKSYPGWGFPNSLYWKIPRYALLPDGPRPWRNIAKWAYYNHGLKTLVFADRNGDIHTGPLSTKSIDKLLGPGWRLVYRKEFRWYYQWHYYFASTWRIRVWQRIPAKGKSATKPAKGNAKSIKP